MNDPEGYYCFGWYPEHQGCGYLTPSEYEEHQKKFRKARVEALYHTDIHLANQKVAFTIYEWDNEFKCYIKKKYDKEGIRIPEPMSEQAKKYWNCVLPTGES